jgi:hypothetical protein
MMVGMKTDAKAWLGMIAVLAAVGLWVWTLAAFTPAQIGAAIVWLVIALILYSGYRVGKLGGL